MDDKKRVKILRDALQTILNRALEHPAFDENLFDARDHDAIIIEGGETADWTETAINCDDALKETEDKRVALRRKG